MSDVTILQEREWLEILCKHLGGRYEIRESAQAMLLSEQPDEAATETLKLIAGMLDTLIDALEGAARIDHVGKEIVLLFTEEDDYYSYLAHFYPSSGHWGLSNGVCIREHEVHTVINGQKSSFKDVLAHELAHSVVTDLRLPRWLDEGVAQSLTRYVLKQGAFCIAPQRMIDHGRYWHWYGLEGFWSGQSFDRPDDLAALSYELAQLLVAGMNAHNPEAFNSVLREVNYHDAGESAVRAHFGVSLVHFVAQILGPGAWFAPAPILSESKRGLDCSLMPQ
jgi:hypothetical protein